ncbi:MAG: hypothetical protein KF843_04505 [Flavobacteriales bacterium]|nr:hypothetical protein [Flavobacteriales bacterium]
MIRYLSYIKTTVELPADLFKALKVKAALESRSLKDLMTEIFREALGKTPTPAPKRRKVALPVVDCPTARSLRTRHFAKGVEVLVSR